MGHGSTRRCSVPVLQTGGKPDHIAGANFLDRTTFAPNPTEAGRNDQSLSKWMRVPGRASARLKRHACAGDARRIGGAEERIDADRPSEIVGRSFARRLRT